MTAWRYEISLLVLKNISRVIAAKRNFVSPHGHVISSISHTSKLLRFVIQVPPSPITVTIGLEWDVTSVGKPIPAAYTTQVANGTVLVDVLNKAADDNTEGPFNKYASTYYGGLGHFITAMNGTEQVSTVQIRGGGGGGV